MKQAVENAFLVVLHRIFSVKFRRGTGYLLGSIFRKWRNMRSLAENVKYCKEEHDMRNFESFLARCDAAMSELWCEGQPTWACFWCHGYALKCG